MWILALEEFASQIRHFTSCDPMSPCSHLQMENNNSSCLIGWLRGPEVPNVIPNTLEVQYVSNTMFCVFTFIYQDPQ